MYLAHCHQVALYIDKFYEKDKIITFLTNNLISLNIMDDESPILFIFLQLDSIHQCLT